MATKTSHNRTRLVLDLPPSEPKNLVAPKPKVGVPLPIVLEGPPSSVALPAIGFNRNVVVRPNEVDRVAPDLQVHVGKREPVLVAEPQEPPLELPALTYFPL